MLVIKPFMVPIDFHSISFSTKEANGGQLTKKETYTGLEQRESE